MAPKPKIVMSGLVVVALQWTLAISAWGGWWAFFAHPAFIALAAVVVCMMLVAPFTGGNFNPGAKEDRGNRWVVLALFCLAVLNAFISPLTDRLGFLTIDGDATRWAGVALFATGGALRLWAVFVLGRRFSGLVAIQSDHKLETGGVYRWVRNPAYLGMLINLLGWALAFRSFVGTVLVALVLIPLIPRMNSEEKLLRDHFGAEYNAYFARTWRLIPWIY
ncbi:MAG: isoprenylcysteine carboxylmethyltransferase family protein [Terracidiphilus sp.]